MLSQINSVARNKTIEVDTNKIYPSYLVDKEPQFPGGKDSLMSYIHQNLKL